MLVGEVYTMEALVPGGEVKCHVTLHKPLLAGTKLYTAPQPPECAWTEDDDGNWDTGCGGLHILIDGRPKDNDMRYCCYCGGVIAPAKADPLSEGGHDRAPNHIFRADGAGAASWRHDMSQNTWRIFAATCMTIGEALSVASWTFGDGSFNAAINGALAALFAWMWVAAMDGRP